MTDPITRCARGARCYTAEPHGDTLVGGPATRPLCDVCEGAVARVLTDTPQLYVRLRLAARQRTIADRGPNVRTTSSHPMPLNAAALHAAEQLHDLLTRWEDEVRLIARLREADRTAMREGRQVQQAAGLLAAHLTAWLNAPTTAFSPDRWQPEYDQSGAQAASTLLDWRQHVRRLPGLDTTAPKALRRYTQPCKTCGIRAITHRAGDDLTQCQSCGATHPYMPPLPDGDAYATEGAA